MDSTTEADLSLRYTGLEVACVTLDNTAIIQASPDFSGPIGEVSNKNAPTEAMNRSGMSDIGIGGHKEEG